MVFWLREVFPPMETIRPVMAVTRDNLFKGGYNSPEIRRVSIICIHIYMTDGSLMLEVGLDSRLYAPDQPLQVEIFSSGVTKYL